MNLFQSVLWRFLFGVLTFKLFTFQRAFRGEGREFDSLSLFRMYSDWKLLKGGRYFFPMSFTQCSPIDFCLTCSDLAL